MFWLLLSLLCFYVLYRGLLWFGLFVIFVLFVLLRIFYLMYRFFIGLARPFNTSVKVLLKVAYKLFMFCIFVLWKKQ